MTRRRRQAKVYELDISGGAWGHVSQLSVQNWNTISPKSIELYKSKECWKSRIEIYKNPNPYLD